MPWQQLTVTTDNQSAQRVADLLEALGALSVTLQDAADEPLYEPDPENIPIWQCTRVTGLFEASAELNPECIRERAQIDGPRMQSIQLDTLQDQVWERVWLDDFKPMQFGPSFWVCATEHTCPDPTATQLTLDPGLAFGTGTHPTTALCLEWLAEQPTLPTTLIDYGCGSGILGIAALLLGAERAVGVDIDSQALEATIDNARKNRVADRLQVYSVTDFPGQSAPLVLANILAGPLIDLSASIGGLVEPSGDLLLSGILNEQHDDVVAAYASSFERIETRVREDWVCIHLQRKAPPV